MKDPAVFAIATREKWERLFETETVLGVGKSFSAGPMRVTGYAQAAILAISDQPFTVTITEATVVDQKGKGNFVQTQSLSSSSVAGLQVLAARITPFGEYMKAVLANTGGPMASLNFLLQGIPAP